MQYVYRVWRRSGALWEDRLRSWLIQEDGDLLTCMRYIELEPVRAGIMVHPAECRWSGHRGNAQREADVLLAAHAL